MSMTGSAAEPVTARLVPSLCVAADASWPAAIADWLAGVFLAAPTVATIESYRCGFGAGLLTMLAGEPNMRPGVGAIRSALAIDEPAEAVARRLSTVFTQIFDGVGGPQTVPLYESAHVGPSGRLSQAPAAGIDRWLRRFGQVPDARVSGPPDHLSIELALLAWLMRRHEPDGAESDFLDRHLLPWIPTFAARCAGADRTGFYAGAATLLLAFLCDHRAALQSPLPAGDFSCHTA